MGKKSIVCLDPVHGPKTVNGSPDGAYKECEFAWDMYKRLRSLLEKQGIEIIGTRTENEKPSLSRRCEISNNGNADLFISIHSDAVGGGDWNDVNGFTAITSAPPSTHARNVFARALCECLKAVGVKPHGDGLAHNDKLTVLVKTDAPACLIEYGFHTNKDDVKLLKDGSYRDKLSSATTKGVCEFLGVEYKEDATMTKDEAKQIVKEKAKLSDATIQFIAEDYRYGDDLIVKLAEAMK